MDRPKILLVASDNARRPAFSGLFKILGFHVLTAVSAEYALTALKENFQPAVIIVDMDLEEKKAHYLLREIKKNPSWESIPLISFTKFLDYKLTGPRLSLDRPAQEENSVYTQARKALKDHVSLVPGEIVLWVAEAIAKKNLESMPILTAACDILNQAR